MTKDILEKQPHKIPSLIAAGMLLGALADVPYGYYQLLRFVVCGVSGYVAFMAYSLQKMWAVWVFGFIALLFNPLIPIYLSREVWQPIDFICAVLFFGIAFVLKKPDVDTSTTENAHEAESTGIKRLSILENKLKDKNEKEKEN